MNDSSPQEAKPIDDIQLDPVPQDEDDIQQDTAQVEGALIASAQEDTLADVVRDWLLRVRAGDLGSIPIILGFVIIAIIFGINESLFFSARNFVNLLLQMAGITAIAIGVVFVLLIAEIDLSIAFVGGVAAVVMVLLLRGPSPEMPWAVAMPWPVAIGGALAVTLLIGFLQGALLPKRELTRLL